MKVSLLRADRKSKTRSGDVFILVIVLNRLLCSLPRMPSRAWQYIEKEKEKERPQLIPAREANFVCKQTSVKSYTYQKTSWLSVFASKAVPLRHNRKITYVLNILLFVSDSMRSDKAGGHRFIPFACSSLLQAEGR